jgi:hypothetical protein
VTEYQLSKNLRNFLPPLGCVGCRSTLALIYRMRSRVTERRYQSNSSSHTRFNCVYIKKYFK